ncbi:MAG: hypothetical protein ACYDHU_00680 [Acidimicrobiales bacterium]
MGRSRYRSVSYDLEASIAVARAVADSGGDTSPAELASVLGYSGTRNGAFLSRMASARRFGLIAGRGERVLLTERARAVLTGSEPVAARARMDACRSVPLYDAVLRRYPDGRLPPDVELATVLVEDFGETPARSRATAVRLGAVLAQSGFTGRHHREAPHRAEITDYGTRNLFIPVVALPAGTGVLSGVDGEAEPGGAMKDGTDQRGMWIDDPGEPAASGSRTKGRPGRWRSTRVAAAAVACLAMVGVPVGLVLAGGGGGSAVAMPPVVHRHGSPAVVIGNGPAEQSVLSALSATTASGSFDLTYSLSRSAPTTAPPVTSCPNVRTLPGLSTGSQRSQNTADTATTSPTSTTYTGSRTPTTVIAHPPCAVTATDRSGTVVSGQGVIDTNPLAMVVSTSVGPTVRIDTTDYWEVGGSDTLAPTTPPRYVPSSGSTASSGTASSGTASSGTASSGSPLSGFASLVEGTLGTQAGAVAMVGMASPTGYLDLTQNSVTGAGTDGTGTVNGDPVTWYVVQEDVAQLADAPGVTPQEAQTIGAAVAVLNSAGYSGTRVTLGVDASGFVRQSTSVASFADGGTVTLEGTYSNFGCAGTVLMPGQSGSGTAPAGCVSPDTGKAASGAATSPGG